jgi:hypothetical protein
MGWREIMELENDTQDFDIARSHTVQGLRARVSLIDSELIQSYDNELIRELSEELKRYPDDPVLLSGWLELLSTNRMIEAGIVPPSFVHDAVCRRCGDIFLDYRVDFPLEACCWCFSSRRPPFKR